MALESFGDFIKDFDGGVGLPSFNAFILGPAHAEILQVLLTQA